MNINRFNYEEYFLLYIDNELSADDKAAVEQFVSVHPDLNEELVLLQQSVIRPEKQLVFTGKASLMKSSVTEGGINKFNFEAYFILYLDNELNTPEKVAVEKFLYTHPEFESAFEQFQQVKVESEKIIFPAKESLYRHEKDRKVISMRWGKIVAAATVILVAGWLYLNQSSQSRIDGRLSKSEGNQISNSDIVTDDKANIKSEGNNPMDEVESSNVEKRNIQKQPSPSTLSSEKILTATSNTQMHATEKRKITSLDNAVKQDQQQLKKKALVTVLPAPSEISTALTKLATSAKPLVIVKYAVHPQVEEDNHATLTFATDRTSENVFLANISVHNNAPLRGLFRKASRVVNKVAALKNGHKPGISIGNVEIAIQ